MRDGPDFYSYQSARNQDPDNPPPPEPEGDPTHDVPAFPEQDSPPGTETAAGPGEHENPDEGDDDVDEDDLDPQVPHSPPDGKKGRIVFDENGVAGLMGGQTAGPDHPSDWKDVRSTVTARMGKLERG